MEISIHAPRTGSDLAFCDFSPAQARFQSTLPARGATLRPSAYTVSLGISIHAPRTGSDIKNEGDAFFNAYISIHAPRTGSDVRFLNLI